MSGGLRPLRLHDGLIALAVAAALLAGTSRRIVPGVTGAFHDDAVYATTAVALADGEGYRLRNLPGAPPQTKYPILYPALLSVASKTATEPPDRLVAMQFATASIGAAAWALAYLFAVRFSVASRAAAAVVLLLLATAPNVLYFAGQTLSELPFLAFLVAGLWAGERALRGGAVPAPLAFATGVALGLPMLCRGVGFVLPLAALLLLLRARRPLAFVALGIAVVDLPWIAWSLSAAPADDVTGYHTDYLGWFLDQASPHIVASNFYRAGVAFGQLAFEGLAREAYAKIAWTEHALFAIGVVPWLAVFLRRRAMPLVAATLAAYLAVVLLWPWPPNRFVLPLLPLLGFAVAAAAQQMAERRPALRRALAVAGIAFAAVAALSNLQLLERYSTESREAGYPYFVLPYEPVPWAHYESAFAWLREHAKDGEVLAAGFDTMTAWYTARPTIRPYVASAQVLYYGAAGAPLGDAAAMEDALRRYDARYLFVSPMPAYAEENAFYELVDSLRERSPDLLVPRWQPGDDARFAIFEVRPAS
jgi:hypothetical protein